MLKRDYCLFVLFSIYKFYFIYFMASTTELNSIDSHVKLESRQQFLCGELCAGFNSFVLHGLVYYWLV